MKRIKTILVVVLVLVAACAGWGLYLYVIAGELDTLEPHFTGTCRRVAGVVGAEDITIHPSGAYAYISSDDRRATRAGKPVPGAIYLYDLTRPGARPINLTPNAPADFHPHGIGLWIQADAPDRLFVVNHPGASLFGDSPTAGPPHTIEVFERQTDRLVKLRSLSGQALVSPNDVVPLDAQRFYVTNDHGNQSGFWRTLEDYLLLERASVVYYDGAKFERVAGGLQYSNGINLSRDQAELYVAETTARRIAVFKPDLVTGRLEPEETISVDTGPDNIELDAEGALWIGCHAKLLTFVSHAADPATLAPSQVLRATKSAEGKWRIEEIYLNLGEELSASSVAARYGGRLLIGPVFDDHFLDCRLGRVEENL